MVLYFVLGLVSLVFIVLLVVIATMTAIHRSVGYEFPTPKQLEKDLDLNPLFRYLPDLKETLPWVSIGNFPTPIHRAEIKIPDKKQLRFYVKVSVNVLLFAAYI